MDSQMIKNIQHNITNTPLRPVYADEIVVAHTIKSSQGKKEKKVEKEAHLHLVFVDMTTQKPVDKVVISLITAKGLYKALGDTLARLDKELRSNKVGKDEKADSDNKLYR
jgi:transcription antitermination factor NusG